MKPIRGFLLDIDGTLIDSNNEHARAWVEALAENGRDVSFEAVRPLIGMGGDKLIPHVCGISANSQEGKQISDCRGAIFLHKYLPRLRPCRGTEDLLDKFQDLKLRLTVASSAKREELQALLRICNAGWLIRSATSSDDAERSKPDPDIVHVALREIDLKADEVIFLGDTPYDVEAGKKARVGVVALRCGGWKDPDLKADRIYDDPADLALHLDEFSFAK
jgi:HAD superfamily hydrolase (TIGR01509 family)